MKKLKIFLLLFICLFYFRTVANVAMPGFYSVGGNGVFIPYFAKDSLSLGKIEMQKELITILLYKGFAVVKGEYWMNNLKDETLILNTGYPINSMYDNKTVYSVHFDDLYALKVLVNDIEVKNNKLQGDSVLSVNKPKHLRNSYNNNWYIWQSEFKPKALSKIMVYFMVHTNQAHLRKGYNNDANNGFTYILESGRAWAKSISQGRIFIQLREDLAIRDIKGILPKASFKANEKTNQLFYDFSNLEPDSSDNILIRYGERQEKFDFQAISKDYQKYYAEIDKIKTENIISKDFKTFSAADFEVHNRTGGFWVSFFMFFAVFGLPLGIIALLGIIPLIWYFRGRTKEKQA